MQFSPFIEHGLSLRMRLEIGRKDFHALFPQDARRHLGLPERIFKHQLRAFAALVAQDVLQIRIACAVDQPSQPDPDQCAAAHEAGFAAGVQRVLAQIGDARLGAELPDQPASA